MSLKALLGTILLLLLDALLIGCTRLPTKTEPWCAGKPHTTVKRRKWWSAFAATFSGLAIFAATPAYAERPDLLEVMTIDSEINDGVARGIAEKVEKINDNAKVKAVLLQLDTPGGAIASAVIYEELAKLKVPVVVWCMNLCASGGVYVAMAPSVKFIAVRTETIGGSVGVIMEVMRYHRLLDWAKVDVKTYTSGPLKDPSNPTRAGTDGDDAFLKEINASLAQRFYELVEKSRGKKIRAEDWPQIKSARIFIGSDVVKIGLADAVMTKEEVTAKAKELSGSKNIHTREELTKMSTSANDRSDYAASPLPAKMESVFGDIGFLIDTLKEIKGGQKVRVMYKMPLQF